MRPSFAIFLFACLGIALQSAILPAFIPRMLQPDLFILIGVTALAYGSIEFGLATLFFLGIAADLIGGSRLGLTPLCYVLAAGVICKYFMRELTRGDLFAAWLGGLAATIPVHILFLILNAVFGNRVGLGFAAGKVLSLTISTCFWGLPVVYLTGSLMFKLRVMSPQVYARWMNDERTTATGRRAA